jgi:thiosulfate dehydrogenase
MKGLLFVLLGVLLTLCIEPGVAYLYFLHGHLPVAVADAPFPFEANIAHIPLHARIDREMVKVSPLPVNDENLISGALIYRAQCAWCHGLSGHPSQVGANSFPRMPQLWQRHKNKPDVVGVSDDPVGETYWKVKNGIRLSGMPSYKTILSEDQMWQVSLLLSQAAKPLPQAAGDSVTTPLH